MDREPDPLDEMFDRENNCMLDRELDGEAIRVLATADSLGEQASAPLEGCSRRSDARGTATATSLCFPRTRGRF